MMVDTSPTVIAQRKRYMEVISAALDADAPDADFTPEQFVALLRLLVTSVGNSPQERLATWLRDAL
jgi:hypothetical protein